MSEKKRRRRFLRGSYAALSALLLSLLLFPAGQILFRDPLYILPLLFFLSLGFSVLTEHPLWQIGISAIPPLTFFVPQVAFGKDPRFTPGFAVYFTLLLTGGAVLFGRLYRQLRREKDLSQAQYRREQTTSDLSARLLTASTMDDLCSLTMESIYRITECPAVLFLPDKKGRLSRRVSYPEELMLYADDETVQACFAACAPTGRGTGICKKSAMRCLPVHVDGKVLAVTGLLTGETSGSEKQLRTVESLLIRFAVALDRLRAMEQAQENLMEKELEHIRTDFLRSISHDLRTPLTGIIGACSALEQPGVVQDESTRRSLVAGISQEAVWLLRMVENLLSITRVGSNAPKLKLSCEPMEEVLSEVVEKARSRYPSLLLHITQPEELLLVPMDPNLIVQVLLNLLDNANKYSPSPAEVDITVAELPSCIRITVADQGKGMTEEELSMLFEPLPPHAGDSTHGMGLGLSICKSIMTAHGGTIEGRNRQPKGAVFTITLPKEAQL